MVLDDSILQAANMSEQELKVELALMLYTQKRFSFGQARQLSGMRYFDFKQLLFDRNIPAHYDVDEFEEDLKTIEKLRRGRNPFKGL